MGEAITRHSLRPLLSMRAICLQDSDATRRENNISRLVRRVGKANGSRKCAPDDRLRVPTVRNAVGTARRAFAHPTRCESIACAGATSGEVMLALTLPRLSDRH